jgi:uncharacterized protein (TIGR00730 family)
MATLQRVCVYCGSSDSVSQVYLDAARAMGKTLADRHLTVVFGGGKTGMMGALADSALGAGGEVIGVIPELFNTPQLVHSGLSALHVVDSMQTRKAQMASLSDGFIALPGGFGTFEELFETLTGSQVGLHDKPVAVLNSSGYFDRLLEAIDFAKVEGFIYDEHRSLILCHTGPGELIDQMMAFRPQGVASRWLRRHEEE